MPRITISLPAQALVKNQLVDAKPLIDQYFGLEVVRQTAADVIVSTAQWSIVPRDEMTSQVLDATGRVRGLIVDHTKWEGERYLQIMT